MSDLVSADYFAARTPVSNRPNISYHAWHDLLFVHWRVPPSLLAPMLPPRITLDPWEGDAMLGMVLFRLSRVRPWWSTVVPGVSAFRETNVRTYVRFEGRDPGIWFFSLDASKLIAVTMARKFWNLKYFWASMQFEREGDRVRYRSRRRWPGPSGGHTDVEAEIGGPTRSIGAGGEVVSGFAAPGSLEFFLAERYLYYTQTSRGKLIRGGVEHTPYPLCDARLTRFDESLVAADGIQLASETSHVIFSPGVEVRVVSPELEPWSLLAS